MEPLLDALHDEDAGVREHAAKALGRLGDAAVEPLLAALRDEDESVRVEAAEALGQIGDVRAVQPLLTALHDAASRRLEWRAVKALGQIGDTRAVQPLLAALHDENQGVRKEAANALSQIGTMEVLEKLLYRLDIHLYDEDIFPVVRRLALKFSHQRPRPACLPVYPQPRPVRWLRKLLWWVKIGFNRLRRRGR